MKRRIIISSLTAMGLMLTVGEAIHAAKSSHTALGSGAGTSIWINPSPPSQSAKGYVPVTEASFPIQVSGCGDALKMFGASAAKECVYNSGTTVNFTDASNNTCMMSITGTSVDPASTTCSYSPAGDTILLWGLKKGRAPSGGGSSGNTVFSGVGVDYAPGHYSPTINARNQSDWANVYPELKQLQKAGFTTVRMYGEPAVTWIAVINAANQLGMNVIYQLNLCETDGSGNCVHDHSGQTYQDLETQSFQTLDQVISNVGAKVFQSTVKAVIVGNEILSTHNPSADAARIVDTISKVQQFFSGTLPSGLSQNYTCGCVSDSNGQCAQPISCKFGTYNITSMPITISLQADVWMGAGNPPAPNAAALKTIANALPPGSPIAMNVYPFQWMQWGSVTPKGKDYPTNVINAVTSGQRNSLSWYVNKIKAIYGRDVMISETGWASNGEYCDGSNCPIQGDVDNAVAYYKALYQYALANKIPLLTFMAFDTPTKASASGTMGSEDYYGVFNQECKVKTPTASQYTAVDFFPPAGSAYSSQYTGCSDGDAVFTFNGTAPVNVKPPYNFQPGFWILVNYSSGDQSVISVPSQNRYLFATPWPHITLQVNDTVTLTNKQPVKVTDGSYGVASGALKCQNTVASIDANNNGGAWVNAGTGHGGTGCNTINWAAGQNVYLPGDFGKVTKNTVIIAPGGGVTGSFVVANQSPISFSGPNESLAQVSDGQAVTLVVNCGSGKQLTCQGSYSKGVLILNSPSLCANKYASGVNWQQQKQLLSLALPPQSACKN